MIFILIYQCFLILLAYKNAQWASPKDEWKIRHRVNGIFHISASLLIGVFIRWELGVANILFTRVFFDALLNRFRDLGLGYISPDPDSKFDKAEKWIVLKLASIIYRNQRRISDEDIERVAIGFRIFILGLATGSLFI